MTRQERRNVTMPKKKTGGEMRPWLTENIDCKEKRFIQVGNHLLLSKRFQNLSPGAQTLYLCMAMESGGRKGFTFPLSTALKFGFAKNSFWRYRNELDEKHFIKYRSNRNIRKPNEYEFCLEWKTLPPSAT